MAQFAIMPLLLLVQAISFGIGIVIIAGSLRMMKLKSHGLATVASVLAMLPCGPAWLFGLPMGIWSLVVLNRAGVKAAFRNQKPDRRNSPGGVAGVESSRPQALASQQPPAWGSQTPPQPPIAVSITWPRLPAWYGWVFGAGFVVAFVVTVVFVRITMNSPSQPGAGSAPPPPSAPDEASQSPASRAGWIMGSNGPALTDVFVRWVLKLQPAQIEQVNEILQAAHREYLTIEQQNTEQHTDDAGHFVTTIKPFPNPLAKLEHRLWSQLDAILDSQQQSDARLNLRLHPKLVQAPMALSEIVAPGFFGWGKDGAQIEIWRVGTWFHWRIGTRGYSDSAHSAAGLPVEYRRFWKEPATDDARIQGTWNYVANIYDGEVTDPEEFKLWKEVFAKGEWTAQSRNGSFKGTHQLDRTKTPPTIDIVCTEGPDKGFVMAGIYELDGDNLKICLTCENSENANISAISKVQRVNGVECHSPMAAESLNRKPQASALNRDRLRPNALACACG